MRVEVDLSGIEGFLSGKGLESARELFADQVKNAMEEYVPLRTGALRDSAVASGEEIDYTVDYAPYVYEMPEGANWTTEGTSGHWDERVAAEKGNELCEWLAAIIEGAM